MAYLVLVFSVICSAVGIVAQTVAARRVESRTRLDPGILTRLFTDRLYLMGFAAQVLAFGFAFLARATLPLFLVQAGSSTAVGLATAIGAVVLRWRIRAAEIAALGVMAAGLLLLVAAAQPAPSSAMPVGLGFALLGALPVVVGVAIFAARLRGGRSAVALGVLAGIAWAVLAIASRPLAEGPLLSLPLEPLAWLMVAAAVVGQSLMAAALQRGSTTSVMASMDSTTTVVSSVVGLAFLGDLVVAGREPWVAAGLVLIVAGVSTMAVVGRHTSATTSVPTSVGTSVGKEAAAG